MIESKITNQDENDKLRNGPDPVKEQLEWKDDELFVWTHIDQANLITNRIEQRVKDKELKQRWLKTEILPLRDWLVKHGFIKSTNINK